VVRSKLVDPDFVWFRANLHKGTSCTAEKMKFLEHTLGGLGNSMLDYNPKNSTAWYLKRYRVKYGCDLVCSYRL